MATDAATEGGLTDRIDHMWKQSKVVFNRRLSCDNFFNRSQINLSEFWKSIIAPLAAVELSSYIPF